MFLNSCNTRKEDRISKEIVTFFNQKKKQEFAICINSDSELYEIAKRRNDKNLINSLIEACNASVDYYDFFRDDSTKQLDSLYKNEETDFVILNMINIEKGNILVNKSTVTISRKRNDKNIHIISNHYEYDEIKKSPVLLKDSSLLGFNAINKLEIIEGILYNNVENSMITEKKRGKYYSEYFVVTRIKGRSE